MPPVEFRFSEVQRSIVSLRALQPFPRGAFSNHAVATYLELLLAWIEKHLVDTASSDSGKEDALFGSVSGLQCAFADDASAARVFDCSPRRVATLVAILSEVRSCCA